MQLVKPVTVILTLCISPVLVKAENVQLQFFSGNDIYPMCQTSPGFVMGYVTGAIDYAHVASSATGNSSIRVCLPRAVDNFQARDVFCKYLADNPATRHFNSSALLFNAMRETYPCTE